MSSVYYDPFLVAAAQQAQAQAQAAANTIQAAQVDQNYRLQVCFFHRKYFYYLLILCLLTNFS